MTPEMQDKIINAISTTSDGLRKICKDAGIALSTLFLFKENNKEFSERYARAKVQQAELLADQIVDIADDDTNDMAENDKGDVPNNAAVNRARLRVDARKWVLAKLLPHQYGDRNTVGVYETDEPAKSPAEIAWEKIAKAKGIA